MMSGSRAERFEIALNTPAGRVTTVLDVPTGFVPITAIVPVSRRLGEEVASLESERARQGGQSISCRAGCAACCRMLVPLSPPEAFALRDYVEQLPAERRTAILQRVDENFRRLDSAGLLDRLKSVADAATAISDEDLEPLNSAYYALRQPCPFLENEMCSIYEARPAACRELLVTSPAELCEDLVHNPVTPLPVSLRIGTILGCLWGTLTESAPRLIPLPLALRWAEQHQEASRQTWSGPTLIDQTLDWMWRFLSQEFQTRSSKL